MSPNRLLDTTAWTRRHWLLLVLALATPTVADEPRRDLAKVRIALVGDSTVADGSGWGPGFADRLGPDAECLNRARSGRSSKSYRDEGHWTKVLEAKPDYILIQFGHNDQPGKGPERETDPKTTFRENMARYVDEARAIGAKPVLITSLARRHFNPDGTVHSTLGPYVEAVKSLAAEKDVPLIDLHALSIALLEQLGPEASAEFDPKPVPGRPGPDKTHLSPRGSTVFGQLVAEELKKVAPALAPYLK